MTLGVASRGRHDSGRDFHAGVDGVRRLRRGTVGRGRGHRRRVAAPVDGAVDDPHLEPIVEGPRRPVGHCHVKRLDLTNGKW